MSGLGTGRGQSFGTAVTCQHPAQVTPADGDVSEKAARWWRLNDVGVPIPPVKPAASRSLAALRMKSAAPAPGTGKH